MSTEPRSKAETKSDTTAQQRSVPDVDTMRLSLRKAMVLRILNRNPPNVRAAFGGGLVHEVAR